MYPFLDGGSLSAGPSTALTAHNLSAAGNGAGLSMDQLPKTLNDLCPASSFPPLASFCEQTQLYEAIFHK